jgi:hypothetical protein
MHSLRLPLRLYVTGVILVGGTALALGAATLRPVHLTHETKVTVEDAATFAAALLLAGPSLATLPAIAIAAALKFGVNSTIVDVAVAFQLRRRPLAKW